LFNYFSRQPALNIDMLRAQEGSGVTGRQSANLKKFLKVIWQL
jgi:hypothetical protein